MLVPGLNILPSWADGDAACSSKEIVVRGSQHDTGVHSQAGRQHGFGQEHGWQAVDA